MTPTRSTRLSIAGLAAAAATVVALLPAAGDARARGGCPDNKVCISQDNLGGGELVKIGKQGVSNKLAEQMNNEASSLVNNRSTKVTLYDKKNAKPGENRCFEPGAVVGALSSVDFDDVASSTRVAGGQGNCPA